MNKQHSRAGISTPNLSSLSVPLQNKIYNQPSNHTWQEVGQKCLKLSRLLEAYPYIYVMGIYQFLKNCESCFKYILCFKILANDRMKTKQD